jgi:hypothetical protein
VTCFAADQFFELAPVGAIRGCPSDTGCINSEKQHSKREEYFIFDEPLTFATDVILMGSKGHVNFSDGHDFENSVRPRLILEVNGAVSTREGSTSGSRNGDGPTCRSALGLAALQANAHLKSQNLRLLPRWGRGEQQGEQPSK